MAPKTLTPSPAGAPDRFRLGSAPEGATALVAAVKKAAERRGRDDNLPRGRFTLAAFLACIRRPLLTPSYVEDLRVELLKRGYAMIDLGDVVALVPESSVRRWTRVRTDTVDEVVDQIEKGKFDFAAQDAAIATMLGSAPSGDQDDSTN